MKIMITLTPDSGLKLDTVWLVIFAKWAKIWVSDIFMVSESGTHGLASSIACKCVHSKSWDVKN